MVLSNFPPGVSANDPHIAGEDRRPISTANVDEELVLVHNGCGEVFHAKAALELLQLAGVHGNECEQGTGDNDDWSIDFYDEVM